MARARARLAPLVTLAVAASASPALGDRPAVESIAPTSGPAGTIVDVVGRGLGGASRARIGETELDLVEVMPSRVRARVPSAATTGLVSIETPSGVATGPEFRVTAPLPAPVIESFEPKRGAPGTRVTLRGRNFSPRLAANAVTLAGHPVIVDAATPVALTVIVPAIDAGGPFRVRVVQAGEASSAEVFEVVQRIAVAGREPSPVVPAADPAPKLRDSSPAATTPLAIADFAPKSGPAGTVVTIEGRGFDASAQRNSVRIGGQAAEVLEVTDTRLALRVPSGGSGRIEVRVPSGDRARTSEAFVVTDPPRVDSVLPDEGTVGSDLAIRGRGFGVIPALVRVTLGGHPLEVRSVRDDLLVARITPGAVSGKLQVHVRLQGAGELAEEIRVLGALVVAGVDPSRAAAGERVTVRGAGFVPGAIVEFGGVPSAPQTIAPDRIRVAVPDGARSGIVVVRLADGRNSPGPEPFLVSLAN